MKKKLLHMLLGTVIIIGCSTSTIATEVSIAEDESIVYTVQEEIQPLENINAESEIYDEITEDSYEEEAEIIASVEVNAEVSTGEKVVSYAKQFIGTPYVSGGNNLYTGVDCSGFTKQVYKNFGVNLERSSSSQYACNGHAVSKEELKEGDLVFYGYGSVCHVAIYVGNDEVIHAPVPGQSVCIAPLWQRGDAPIMGYKRIFND